MAISLLENSPTLKDQEYIKTLFRKYLDCKCSPDEIKELFKLISKKSNEGLFDNLIDEEMRQYSATMPETDKHSAVLGVIKNTLLSEIRAQNSHSRKKINPYKISNTWLKVAAVWLLIGTTAMFLFFRHFSDKNNAERHQLITHNGQKKYIQLFDGTKIWLSPSSTIKYADQLIANYREVWLDGEAFFEVAKDKKHPFIIHSGRMQTEVVGTSFNITSYIKENIYHVTVVTGIVKVAMLSDRKQKISEVILKPKGQADFDNKQATLSSKEIATIDPVVKKKNGILSYDGTPVPEVVADFKRYFNVPIELENKSATCLCYGEFDTSKPVNIALSQLTAAIGASVVEKNGGYVIQGGCADE